MNSKISQINYINYSSIHLNNVYYYEKGASVKIILLLLMVAAVLLGGCSMGRYTVADRYLKENNYQSALTEFVRVAEMNGSLAMSRDVRALTGAMIAYYKLNNFKNSFALSKRILSLDKYNSSAIFYAGLNLEMLNKPSLAKKIYRFYTAVSRFDPYYKLIKAKFNQLVQDEIKKRAQLAIQMENNISTDQIDPNTIAVLYFLNVIEDPEWNALSKGLAEMMITDLSQVKQLKVLERIFLQKLIEEMQLGMTGLMDESTAPRMGRLMKARNLINGAFTIKAGQYLGVTSNLLDVTSSGNIQTREFSGDVNKIFDIEKEIVFITIDQLGIQLTAEERKRIGQYATRNFNAFKAYCYGLEQYDLGNFSAAMMYFQQAITLDPNFGLAQDMFDITLALERIDQGTFVAMYFDMNKTRLAPDDGMVGSMSTQYRLNQISQNLDLGYLPGNDSRNGASEIIHEEHYWSNREREILLEPPRPPTIPPNK